MTHCVLCQREGSPVPLKKEDRKELPPGTDPTSLVLCHVCSKLLENKVYARNVLVGLFRLNAKAMGHPNPHGAAEALERKLKEKG